jgi:phage-related protein
MIFFNGFWDWLKNFFAQWGPLILAVIAPFIGIPILIAQNWEQIKEFFSVLWNDIKTETEEIWNGIKTFFRAKISANTFLR